jgi:hypothetical protein
MTLDEILQQKLSSWRPPEGRHALTASEEAPGWTVQLTADRCDDVGCLIWELTLTRAPAAPARSLDLAGWAQVVARRVTGLLESLKVIEIDGTRHEGLLRSNTALRRGDKLFYYEILLSATTQAQLRRYQAPQTGTGPRQQVAFALTHESLAKLIADLTADK